MRRLNGRAASLALGTGRHWRVRGRWLVERIPPVGKRGGHGAQQLIEGKRSGAEGGHPAAASQGERCRSAGKPLALSWAVAMGGRSTMCPAAWGPHRPHQAGSEATTFLVFQRGEHQDLGREVALRATIHGLDRSGSARVKPEQPGATHQALAHDWREPASAGPL